MAASISDDFSFFVKDLLSKPKIFLQTLAAESSGRMNSEVVTEAAAQTAEVVRRQELIAKLVSTLLGLTVSGALTYFGVKWIVKAMDPTWKEKQESQKRAERLMKKIGVSNVQLTDYELCVASNLIDPSAMKIKWQDIGGLDRVIKEVVDTVILPFQQPHLFDRSTLLQPPKGVLLHGPPGCGKTMIAKATAKAAGARFINLQVSTLFDKWYGESQKRAEAVFSLAVKLQPCIVFIDELDSFLRSRSGTDHEVTAMMKTQFMSWWDGLCTDPRCRVLVMGATNRPQDVDAAILRRMPATFYIGLPSKEQRERILGVILKDEDLTSDVSLSRLASEAEGCSGSDLRELCRVAALYTLNDYTAAHVPSTLNAGEGGEAEAVSAAGSDTCLRAITMADFTRALDKLRSRKVKTTGLLNTLPYD